MANVRGVYFGPDLSLPDNQFLNVTTLEDLIFQTTARTTGLKEYAPDAERVYDYGIAGGNKADGPAPTLRNGWGVLIQGFGDKTLFDEIYVEIVDLAQSPNAHYGAEHDVGYITEELSLNILIWNAYLSESKSLTDITTINGDGTNLEYPTLPQTLTPGSEIQCDLTVYKNGPAKQDTDHQFTISSDVFTTTITGLRVISLAPEPNWRNGVKYTYQYHTALHQTPRFVEQRRVMVDVPFRAAALEYLMIGATAREFFYNLSYGHDKIFGVPIYSELMTPTAAGLPQGDVTITLSTATTSMWNLNNICNYVAIIDHENNQVEIKKISSIGANSIVCTQTITQLFDEKSARVYPVFFAVVRAAMLNQETDGIDTVKLDFTEFDRGE